MRQRLPIALHATLFSVLAVWQAPAPAELPDPTRPAILPAQASAATAPDGEPAWVLQSVRIGTSGGTSSGTGADARAAVISGQLVRLGERIGDARLVRVTERSVVLQGPQGTTTLWLIADVDKRAARVPAPRPAAAAVPASPSPSSTSVPQQAPSRLAEVTP